MTMTLDELLKAVDELPSQDIKILQAHIESRLQTEIASGTMDVEKLKSAVVSMREGFTQEELNHIADVMDGKTG